MAHFLKEEAAGDQTGNRQCDGEDIRDLVEGEEEDFPPGGPKGGEAGDLFEAHNEKDANERSDAKSEDLEISSQQITPEDRPE
jgi:hypothetical protein